MQTFKKFNYKNIISLILVLFILWFITQIKSISILAFGAFVFTCSLMPIVDKLSKKMPRVLATTIVIIGTIFLATIFFLPIISISIEEIIQIVKNIPIIEEKIINFLSEKHLFGISLISYINIDALSNTTTKMASDLVDKSINITKGLLDLITIIMTVSVIIFYMLNEKNLIKNSILLISPKKYKTRVKEIYEEVECKIGGYVIAQILSMSTVAIFTAIGLIILKIDYAILLGLIAGLLDIIPIVGPTIALVLGVTCAFHKGLLFIILTILVYFIAQWISNNFVRPLIFGKFLNLHPIVIIFSFLIAAQFLGVWGVILSPAIAATILTLFDELYIKTINKNLDN